MAYTGRLSPKRVPFFRLRQYKIGLQQFEVYSCTQRSLSFRSVKGLKRGARILTVKRLRKTSCFNDLLLFAVYTSPKIHIVPRPPKKGFGKFSNMLWEMCKPVMGDVQMANLKGMQHSKLGSENGNHLSIEGIRKGYLWYMKE